MGKSFSYKALITAIALLLTPLHAAYAARQVVDTAGTKVNVPDKVTRIADAWYAHHSLLMTLGAGDEIIATVNHPKDRPWMFLIQPSLNKALSVHGTTFNPETLLAAKADVVFAAQGNGDVPAYRQAQLPTVEVQFTDFPSMKKALLTTAAVLGTPQAEARAQRYNQYLDRQVALIQAKTAALTDAQRPKVLHIVSLHPLKIDGSETLIDTWIRLAGGRNAAASVKGNMKEVSPEQVLAWQPDVIIIGAGAGTLEKSDYAQLFQPLKAVQQHKVWQNPSGVFPWDRYGTEAALQIQWAAQKLHPELFPQLNIVAATQDFYRQFFDYSLTADQAQRIINAQPPAEK
ncbi:ABC transporter substrate-binding protein [Rouxiella sp. T17]|uniref:ABC transporter substrate-binding protein n=1 Tax=Rouxiella sp. T17 TaxID=3085684 RepID=UPI002FC81316